jgi:hypothetical protein
MANQDTPLRSLTSNNATASRIRLCFGGCNESYSHYGDLVIRAAHVDAVKAYIAKFEAPKTAVHYAAPVNDWATKADFDRYCKTGR